MIEPKKRGEGRGKKTARVRERTLLGGEKTSTKMQENRENLTLVRQLHQKVQKEGRGTAKGRGENVTFGIGPNSTRVKAQDFPDGKWRGGGSRGKSVPGVYQGRRPHKTATIKSTPPRPIGGVGTTAFGGRERI